jgi:hypothetical protein
VPAPREQSRGVLLRSRPPSLDGPWPVAYVDSGVIDPERRAMLPGRGVLRCGRFKRREPKMGRSRKVAPVEAVEKPSGKKAKKKGG